jgi:hypothetical protein
MQKECRKCHQKKELTTDFFPHNSKSHDGFDGRCKACWKLISQAKTRAKHDPNAVAQKTVRANAKVRAWEGKLKPKVEIVPNETQVTGLVKISDLPGGGVQFSEFEGSLEAGITEYREKYGQFPQVVYTPGRFFIQIPDEFQDKIEKAIAAKQPPAKAGKSKRR